MLPASSKTCVLNSCAYLGLYSRLYSQYCVRASPWKYRLWYAAVVEHIQKCVLTFQKYYRYKNLSENEYFCSTLNMDSVYTHFSEEDCSIPEIPSSFKKTTNIQVSLSDNN